MPTQVLEVDWVILYFVYGLVFFVMGLVTGLQSRRRSRLELARALPWLAVLAWPTAWSNGAISLSRSRHSTVRRIVVIRL